MAVLLGSIGGFKKYTAKFYDSRNNELYRKTFEAISIKKARELAYNILANTSDDAVKVRVNRA
jgi:hypothetical protein